MDQFLPILHVTPEGTWGHINSNEEICRDQEQLGLYQLPLDVKWVTWDDPLQPKAKECKKLGVFLESQLSHGIRTQLLRLKVKADDDYIVEVLSQGEEVQFDSGSWMARFVGHVHGEDYTVYYFFNILDRYCQRWHQVKFDAIGALSANVPLRRWTIKNDKKNPQDWDTYAVQRSDA